MKKLIFTMLSLLLLTLTASSLSAQPFTGEGYGMGMHKPFQHLEMLQYTFDLTNSQVDKIYKIEKDYMDRFYQNRNDQAKIRELGEKINGEIAGILTGEQKIKWNDFQKNHPANKKVKKDRNFPGAGPHAGMGLFHLNFLQKDLGLTDEQTDKIYKIQKEYMDKFYQNRNDGDKVRELRTKQNAEIENILTAEQKTKLSEYRNRPPRFHDKHWKGKGKPGHPCWADDDKE